MNTTTTLRPLPASINQTLSALILNHWVNYIDFSIRGYTLSIHMVYFIYVIFKKDSELQSRSCLFLHNVNLATFLVALVYTSYIPFSYPSFSDRNVNRILCRMTELFWMWIKYARVYALLLLAIYRFFACVKVRWYKLINSQLTNIYILIFMCWVLSLFMPVVFKYSIGTSYSIYFCTDGFSGSNFNNSVVYYVINTLLSSLLPTFAIFFLYKMLYNRLREQSIKLGAQQTGSIKLKNFARQFIVMNVITSISTVFATFIDFVNVTAAYPEFNYLQEQFKFVRPVMRSLMLITESFVPVVSVYYTSWNWYNFKMWFLKRSARISGVD